MLKAVKLRGPHLVLAYIGGDDRISLRRLANHLEHILRFNDSIRIGIPKRMPRPYTLEAARSRRPSGRLRFRVRISQHVFNIADAREICLDVLADFRRINIDMGDSFGLRRKSVQFHRNPVIETRADRNNEIRILHCHIRRIYAMMSEHAQPHLVIARKPAEPEQGRRDRNPGSVDEFDQLLGGVRIDNAAACDNNRLARFCNRLKQRIYFCRIRLRAPWYPRN